ncbi:MFS transporter [Paenactinomyces guangxiensis]|uniref:MFS transporter n=1 Tax=Paenactinomyces guangxiensis TaxID=1490290 RepID=A0A7W1WUC5_9BACL|nr:MFS transporter [Paenactinomyces guangxiensis]MBA4496107.1 MFS transporter [Paenactinomyces guangxiensis]MBH8593195.1 MFS transporter [Paenactinomyces guangxiensis]
MTRGRELLLIVSLLVGTILVPINSTMIAVGLSAISAYFHENLAAISWVVTIYLIVMAVTQPIAGKLGDLYGNRRIYMWGLALLFLSSIACAFSFNLPWLIAFRSVQAIGGALVAPNASAIIRHAVSKERMAKVFGLFGMGMGLGAAIGPLLGSTLISLWGWKSIFWVNVPFLVFAIVTTWLVLPRHDEQKEASLDWPGSVYLAVSFTLLILLTHPQTIVRYIIIGVLFVFFAILFVYRELRASHPLIQFSLFKNSTFTSANLSILLSNCVMYTTLLAMPWILESDFRLSTGKVGLVMFVFSISMSVAGWIGGQLAARWGNRKMITLSFFVSVIASVLYWSLHLSMSIPYLLFALFVGGLAGGLGNSAMQTASLQSVSKELSGTASGIFSTFRYFGSMISSTLVSLFVGQTSLFVVLLVVSAAGILVARGVKPEWDIEQATRLGVKKGS